VDYIVLPKSSCHANFTIDNDDDNVVNTFVDDKLVVVSVDVSEPTDIMGDDGTPFFVDAK
jgi:hypothetical protein